MGVCENNLQVRTRLVNGENGLTGNACFSTFCSQSCFFLTQGGRQLRRTPSYLCHSNLTRSRVSYPTRDETFGTAPRLSAVDTNKNWVRSMSPVAAARILSYRWVANGLSYRPARWTTTFCVCRLTWSRSGTCVTFKNSKRINFGIRM